jgi:AcrR family transcriptional regulator
MSRSTPPADDSTSATRDLLLDAAERLFARDGFDAASLRAITREAGTNLAAVHYHFGSKEGLARAVFARRVGPLNDERLRLLEVLQARSTAPALEELIVAFVAPALTLGDDRENGKGLANLGALVSRALESREGDPFRALVFEQFQGVRDRFLTAFHHALPELPLAEVHWRFLFTLGAMIHTASKGHLVALGIPGGRPSSREERLRRLVTFLAAGWRATPTSEEPPGASSLEPSP